MTSSRNLPPPRRLVIGLTGLLASSVVAFFLTVFFARPSLDRAEALSPTFLDREGRLLRAFTTPDGHWRLPVEIADVDARYLAMLLAFEDRRFHSHSGVDALAMARAAGQLVTNGRIVSGGSTITMQVARLLHGEHVRTIAGKLRQMIYAWRLERQFSKDEILRLYLRMAPFGGNLEGVRAAAWSWFGREPRRLSPGEAALLVALPQSPEARRPDRNPAAARQARDRVLARALAVGAISREDYETGRREPVPVRRHEFPRLAPHLTEAELKRHPAAAVHRLTLDRDLQAALEVLAREHAVLLGPRLSAAIMVMDNATGQILAHVGSPGYFDQERQGAIDMTDAVRSPGSTLKPLIYGLAFELGLAHPETLIEDRPARFGTYSPKNFDEDFQGTVTIREALAQSLNIPAVKVLAAVGPARLVGRLRRIGLSPQMPPAAEPSLAVALGGVGLRLSDLGRLYVALARGGDAIALSHRRQDGERSGGNRPSVRRLLSPAAAWYVGDILKDAPPPASAKGGGIAYKTGTSYGYRDAWAAGFDGRTTIVVWVGRPDATATPGLTGRSAAAPLLFDAFAKVSLRPHPLAPPPADVRRLSTSALPPPLRRFRDAGEETPAAGGYLDPPVQIAFPPDRAEIEAGDVPQSAIVLKADGGALPLTWLVDGEPLAVDPASREAVWEPAGRGFARISVIDAKGRSDRVEVRLR
jgi:penicillin-binding protein 1C